MNRSELFSQIKFQLFKSNPLLVIHVTYFTLLFNLRKYVCVSKYKLQIVAVQKYLAIFFRSKWAMGEVVRMRNRLRSERDNLFTASDCTRRLS